ncbi:hypothetical protein Pyrde_1367 [Pyrodictium delaneyi]|uniref:Uncharacterized protein n=1 Tax=Pyrodictium delaneyi TaxID=1273541 RepID=A0A0P0N430_9CREN|nr:hypothetical protein [Pyrodictium delaneyi]ALL01413.1 hypothetical protein Pyrde_1367 [Pyrodictium delaneyi]OWJ54487.1 hypothetical protein Pdsh_06740 [Pyrodictium delaneyi]OWJ54667.1 hypothetical protein Pdsh_06525 [Pyrodictium delaneyi]
MNTADILLGVEAGSPILNQLGQALAAATIGGLITALLIAIPLIIVFVIVEAASMLRLDSHEYIVEMPAEDARRRLAELLRFRGLSVIEEPDRITVDDIVRIVISTRRDTDGTLRVLYYAEPKTWLVAAIIILLVINVALGLAVAAIAYLKYDEARKAVKASLNELKARQIY